MHMEVAKPSPAYKLYHLQNYDGFDSGISQKNTPDMADQFLNPTSKVKLLKGIMSVKPKGPLIISKLKIPTKSCLKKLQPI